MKRFKSKKTGTIDTKQPSPLKGGMSAEYLGMSPEDITAYIMGGIASGGPKAAPRPSFNRNLTVANTRTGADPSARMNAALELQREIESLRKQLVDEDSDEDLVL